MENPFDIIKKHYIGQKMNLWVINPEAFEKELAEQKRIAYFKYETELRLRVLEADTQKISYSPARHPVEADYYKEKVGMTNRDLTVKTCSIRLIHEDDFGCLRISLTFEEGPWVIRDAEFYPGRFGIC